MPTHVDSVMESATWDRKRGLYEAWDGPKFAKGSKWELYDYLLINPSTKIGTMFEEAHKDIKGCSIIKGRLDAKSGGDLYLMWDVYEGKYDYWALYRRKLAGGGYQYFEISVVEDPWVWYDFVRLIVLDPSTVKVGHVYGTVPGSITSQYGNTVKGAQETQDLLDGKIPVRDADAAAALGGLKQKIETLSSTDWKKVRGHSGAKTNYRYSK